MYWIPLQVSCSTRWLSSLNQGQASSPAGSVSNIGVRGSHTSTTPRGWLFDGQWSHHASEGTVPWASEFILGIPPSLLSMEWSERPRSMLEVTGQGALEISTGWWTRCFCRSQPSHCCLMLVISAASPISTLLIWHYLISTCMGRFMPLLIYSFRSFCQWQWPS